MCHWSETKFADVLERLEKIATVLGDSGQAATFDEVRYLGRIVKDITHQVAGELQDMDARLQHLEQHLRTSGPARQ